MGSELPSGKARMYGLLLAWNTRRAQAADGQPRITKSQDGEDSGEDCGDKRKFSGGRALDQKEIFALAQAATNTTRKLGGLN